MKKLILPVLVVVALLPACNNDETDSKILDDFYRESGKLTYADLDSIGNFANKFNLVLSKDHELATHPLCQQIYSNIEYARDCQVIGISHIDE